MSLWLSDDELADLTGYKHRQKQRCALTKMGVKFLTRPADGFLLVARSQFDGGKKSREPDWSTLRN
jgi:hypothetical protein